MKRFFAVVLTLALILFAQPASVSAHPEKLLGTYKCVEACGWIMDESKHVNSQSFYFIFELGNSSITNAMKESTRQGASLWRPYGTITEASMATGGVPDGRPFATITTNDQPSDLGIIASTIPKNIDSKTGHASQWSIAIFTKNVSSYSGKAAAHEFGHVFGLVDLYASSNSDKLMYGSIKGSATGVTSSDKKGYYVITLGDNSHSFISYYVRPPELPSNIPVHRQFCTRCNIAKDTKCYPEIGPCNTCGFSH